MNSRGAILGGFVGMFVATAGIALILFLFIFLSTPISNVKIFEDKAGGEFNIYNKEFKGVIFLESLNEGDFFEDFDLESRKDYWGYVVLTEKGHDFEESDLRIGEAVVEFYFPLNGEKNIFILKKEVFENDYEYYR